MKFSLFFPLLIVPLVLASPVPESAPSQDPQPEKTDPLLNDVGIIVIDGIPASWIERDRGDFGESNRWSNRDRWTESRRTEDRRTGSDRRNEWEEKPEPPRRESTNERRTGSNRRTPTNERRVVTDRLVGGGEIDEDIWTEGNSDDRKPTGSRERGTTPSSASRDRFVAGDTRREFGERWGDQDPWRRNGDRQRERWDSNRGPYKYENVQNE